MATAEMVPLDEPHAPLQASVDAFREIETELKNKLLHDRHDKAKHGLPHYDAAAHLSDHDLLSFNVSDMKLVRKGTTAYGNHIFCKLLIPALANIESCYVHFRMFEGYESGAKASVHSVHTEDTTGPDGKHRYRALFTKDDPLEWFDT